MARVTPVASSGMAVRSDPTIEMSAIIRWRVDAIVTSLTASANSPPRITMPSMPVEKSPDTGLTPEWRPCTSEM